MIDNPDSLKVAATADSFLVVINKDITTLKSDSFGSVAFASDKLNLEKLIRNIQKEISTQI